MPNDLATPILGLVGEVGSVAAVLKKKKRDAAAYVGYARALREELGDVLWYLCAVARRAELDLATLAGRTEETRFSEIQAASKGAPASYEQIVAATSQLASRTGDLVNDLHDRKLTQTCDAVATRLVPIVRAVVAVAEAVDVSLQTIAEENLEKTFSRWPLERRYPPRVDAELPLNERLPRRFVMFIEEHNINGKTYVLQKRNGVIVGDRLTDNKAEKDDYRFHDVFHIAYAVHLGWSPVLRALFKAKRKSVPKLDEDEDGARAVLIEEGIATFVFGQALERGFLADLDDRLDYDLLKLVSELVRGFEPEACALWQWERAIVDGFRVFRELRKHRKGYVKADLETHTLTFEPGEDREYD
jgi:NTP pyrophosphatase (non-canonical NTP hydrolase)